jgi:hypothetical protein
MNQNYQPGLASEATGVVVLSQYKPVATNDQTVEITVSQQAERLATDGQATVYFRPEGPRERFAETEVVGRYPAPGSNNSPDEFLPHIALSRRTLPWERNGTKKGDPWLALLLFKKSELSATPIVATKVSSLKARHGALHTKLKDELGYASDTELDLLWVSDTVLKQVLPLESEVPLLCHAQRLQLSKQDAAAVTEDPPFGDDMQDAAAVTEDPPFGDDMWKLDEDACVAVVIGSRLPSAAGKEPEEHIACLVSLEGRSDLPWWNLATDGPRKGWSAISFAGPSAPLGRAVGTALGTAADAADATDAAEASARRATGVSIGLADSATEAVVAQPDLGTVFVKQHALIVLDSWRFMPSTGGDFEEVVKAIRYRKTRGGGVLVFGKLPRNDRNKIEWLTTETGFLDLANPHEETGAAMYRGPLAPIQVTRKTGIAVRAKPTELDDPTHPGKLDYSEAAAFELGRLLTLGEPGVLSDLQAVRLQVVIPEVQLKILDCDPRPPSIAKKDWGVYPEMGIHENVLEHLNKQAAVSKADLTGIAAIKQDVEQAFADLGVQAGGIVDQVLDIDAMDVAPLDAQFADVIVNSQP